MQLINIIYVTIKKYLPANKNKNLPTYNDIFIYTQYIYTTHEILI